MTLSGYIVAVFAFEFVLLLYRLAVDRQYARLGDEEEEAWWARPFDRLWRWTHVPALAALFLPTLIAFALMKKQGAVIGPIPLHLLNVAVLIGLGLWIHTGATA